MGQQRWAALSSNQQEAPRGEGTGAACGRTPTDAGLELLRQRGALLGRLERGGKQPLGTVGAVGGQPA